ncbi:Eukaryotic peptide chain release factor GTP-binding subunit [Tulasnella sp. 418]|nr:Eukaryotic peptide chain release factor GTP-binding subunit [Tulasnella sp. 418]
MGIVVIWPLLVLTLYHVRLLLLNITTIEQVRNQAHRKLTKSPTPPNPFATGRWYRNVAYLVCRPAGYSWVDLSGVALHDSRKVNPTFVVSQVGGSGGRTSESTRDDGEGERWKRSGEYSAR